jgi:hypothetical protein
VNAERAKIGRPPLKRVTQLDEAARYFATDMDQDNYYLSDHDTYDRSGGSLVKVCSWWIRIQSYYGTNWQSLAENIAKGQSTPQGVMNSWMGSSGHRNNILSTSNWEIGVGYYYGSSPYWVQDFGRRSGVYPIIINREAATTESADVSLYIYGQGDWTDMRLRNNSGSWTGWMPFQSALEWTLDGGNGQHTVWVEMRDGGQTAMSSDTIVRESADPSLGNSPDDVHFSFSIPDQRLLPDTKQVTPQNTGNEETLTWAITKIGTWFSASPATGSTPASFWITPDTFDTGTEGTYAGKVTVTVTDPAGVSGSPHEIDVTLDVINSSFSSIHLPLIIRD